MEMDMQDSADMCGDMWKARSSLLEKRRGREADLKRVVMHHLRPAKIFS